MQAYTPPAAVRAAPHAPAGKLAKVGSSSKQVTNAELLADENGLRTILVINSGIAGPWKEHTDQLADLTEQALQNTVESGYFVDFSDTIERLQGKAVSAQDSLALLVKITNISRNPESKLADGHYYVPCDLPNQTRCNTNQITEDEIQRALGLRALPTELNAERSIRISNPTAAIAGYLASSRDSAAFAWDNPKGGGKLGVLETVEGMTAEISEEKTRKVFRECLTSGGDDGMEACAKVGIREGMIDRVKRVMAAQTPEASPQIPTEANVAPLSTP